MSTNSSIGYEDPETGEYVVTYCHWDGYLQGVGQSLVFMNDYEDVKELVDAGAQSTLGEPYHEIRDEPWDQCKPIVYSSKKVAEISRHEWNQDYNYAFMNGEWFWLKGKRAVPLKEALEKVSY